MTVKVLQHTSQAKSWDPIPDHPIAESLVIAALILGACIFGIHTRLLFSLASIWPANALLLGLLLTRPRANNPLTWLFAAAAYVSADLLSGSTLVPAIVLNAINLFGVACGLAAARLLAGPRLTINRPLDAVVTFIVMAAAAGGAALGGALAGPALFDMDWAMSAGLWFSVEFVNFTIFMPVMLALASCDPHKFRFVSRSLLQSRHQAAAITALLASVLVAQLIGGPLASAYIVPAILWCAVTYRQFAASVLAMLACSWILIAGPLGIISLRIDFAYVLDASSFRLGVGMIALGTFVVSSINAAWRKAHEELSYVASHDQMTGLLNRGALIHLLKARLRDSQGRFSLLMLDIDRFKAINDTYGHPVGGAGQHDPRTYRARRYGGTSRR